VTLWPVREGLRDEASEVVVAWENVAVTVRDWLIWT
jgi:hypothetical protein